MTGERYHPEALGEIRQEHIHRYAWAAQVVTGLDIADIASGEGFGSSMLARQAASVVGIDVSAEAAAHAANRYSTEKLRFIEADISNIPLADASVDAVVSFETIEHVSDPEKAVAEIRRILRPSGFLIMSSPNRPVYSDRQGHDNSFHVKEFTGDEFSSLLMTQFPATRLFGQRVSVASSILPIDGGEDGTAEILRDDGNETIERTAREIPMTMYFVALAAAHEDHLPKLPPSLLLTSAYDVYWQMRDDISVLLRTNQHLSRLERARMVLASGYFSTSYYLMQRQGNWQDDLSLAIDYLEHGERAGLRPSPLFDPVYYLATNKDVRDAQLSPLIHYLTHGRKEGRAPLAQRDVIEPPPPVEA